MSLLIFKSLIRQIIPKKYHAQVANLYIRYKCFGFNFTCPFCRGHFRKLLPAGLDVPILREKNVVGGGYRLNATCPHCYSSDRERLIYLYLKNKTNLFYENLKILHVAPEENLQKVLMAWTNIGYLSGDLDSPLAMIKMDITKIPYKDNSFNVVICNHVLEHIPNDRHAAKMTMSGFMPEIIKIDLKVWALPSRCTAFERNLAILLFVNMHYQKTRIYTWRQNLGSQPLRVRPEEGAVQHYSRAKIEAIRTHIMAVSDAIAEY